MPIEVRLLSETPLTKWTFEGFLFVVDVPHVPLEITRYAKGPFAVPTLVGLLAGVCSEMAGEVGRPWKHLANVENGILIIHVKDRGLLNFYKVGLMIY